MSFADTYPTPDHESATARQVAGYRAAEALWLLGRAKRRREMHGPRDTTALNLFALAGAKAETAYTLSLADHRIPADRIASRTLTFQHGDAMDEYLDLIAYKAGHDPDKARRAGYES